LAILSSGAAAGDSARDKKGAVVMRFLALLFLASAIPAWCATPVTVDGLEKIVASLHGKSDNRAATQLSQLELTERLSSARLKQLKAKLPGDESQTALVAVADASEFLDLPASEIPATAAPDSAAQQAMIARTRDYVAKLIPALPNFFATQQTLQFSDGPKDPSQHIERNMQDRKLRLVGTSKATVRYIAGNEELEASRTKGNGHPPAREQPLAEGVFALAYGVVLRDALSGKPSWSHWENGSAGPMAVFHYGVPLESSHYSVPVPGEARLFMDQNAYSGELAIDPASGAILRMTLEAARGATTPVAKANILIVYGPVEIGSRTYTCPARSVALSLTRNLDLQHDIYKFSGPIQPAFYQLSLNDVVYRDYHLFHTEMHVLPADEPPSAAAPQPQNAAPPSSPQTPQSR
jgi:hypothetical protein